MNRTPTAIPTAIAAVTVTTELAADASAGARNLSSVSRPGSSRAKLGAGVESCDLAHCVQRIPLWNHVSSQSLPGRRERRRPHSTFWTGRSAEPGRQNRSEVLDYGRHRV